MRTYCIVPPIVGEGTRVLLDNVVKDLAVNVTTKTQDMSDPKKVVEIKKAFQGRAKEKIKETMPVTEDQADHSFVSVLTVRQYCRPSTGGE